MVEKRVKRRCKCSKINTGKVLDNKSNSCGKQRKCVGSEARSFVGYSHSMFVNKT